jgi:hypothetical protein
VLKSGTRVTGIVLPQRPFGTSSIRFTPVSAETTIDVAREISIGSRKFWVVSEPNGKGWRAHVLEVLDHVGGTQVVGIETTGETRSMADDRAIGQLQHRLQDQSF